MRQKRCVRWGVFLGVSVVLALPGSAGAERKPLKEVQQKYAELAKTFRSYLTTQQRLIKECEEYADNLRSPKVYINTRLTPLRRMRQLRTQCRTIIQDATKLQQSLQAFIDWSEKRASQLEYRMKRGAE